MKPEPQPLLTDLLMMLHASCKYYEYLKPETWSPISQIALGAFQSLAERLNSEQVGKMSDEQVIEWFCALTYALPALAISGQAESQKQLYDYIEHVQLAQRFETLLNSSLGLEKIHRAQRYVSYYHNYASFWSNRSNQPTEATRKNQHLLKAQAQREKEIKFAKQFGLNWQLAQAHRCMSCLFIAGEKSRQAQSHLDNHSKLFALHVKAGLFVDKKDSKKQAKLEKDREMCGFNQKMVQGRIYLLEENYTKAQELFRLALADTQKYAPDEPFHPDKGICLWNLALAAQGLGQTETYWQYVQQVDEIFTHINMQYHCTVDFTRLQQARDELQRRLQGSQEHL